MSERPGDQEKTEQPTSKKLEDAHKKGDVPKSQEVSTWAVMVGITLVISFMSRDMSTRMSDLFEVFLASPHDVPTDGEHLRVLLLQVAQGVLWALALPMLTLAVFALAGNLLQHKPVFTGERLKLQLSKISPQKGLKRMFSSKSLMNFVKGLFKIVLVAFVTFAIVWPQKDMLMVAVTFDPVQILPLVQSMGIRILTGVLSILGVIAVIDYLYERFEWLKKQKMSLQEIKDEHKQMEGDPAIRAKLRQLRMERGKNRIAAAVPEASVVIMNPTHFAVALKYEKNMGAPVCVAKGLDALALKMRDIAEEHNVPVVENPPLARALHASVEIDEEIPPEHYRAVAEVIGYIMRLRGRISGRSRRRRQA